MFSKSGTETKAGDDSGKTMFLSDIDAIAKSLNVDKALTRFASSTASSRSKSVLPESKSKLPKDAKKNKKENSLEKDKKSSFWSWKGLKALTQVRNRRFRCCFSLLVHSIEGLPPYFDDLSLIVHWKRKDGEQITQPIMVYQGLAEFGKEQLTHSCYVYGSRSGSHRSAKYEEKHFLLYASVYDAPELDLGKHRMDLTRLLPLTLEELEEEKSSGKWTTSFRLSGKAQGATMNVSFGYVLLGNNDAELSCNQDIYGRRSSARIELLGEFDERNELSIRRAESLPARSSTSSWSVEDIKDLHEVLPMSSSELSESMDMLYQKQDGDVSNASTTNKLPDDSSSLVDEHSDAHSRAPADDGELYFETECEISEFSIIDKGIEELTKEQVKSENGLLKDAQVSGQSFTVGLDFEDDATLQSPVEECFPEKDEHTVSISNSKEKAKLLCFQESVMEELETTLSSSSDLVNRELIPQDENDYFYRENCLELKSLSLDDITDSVASDFFDMLQIDYGSESESESPRERLLRQFEEDFVAYGEGLLNFELDNDTDELSADLPLGSVWEKISKDSSNSATYEGLEEKPKMKTDTLRAETRTPSMEDLETEALMLQWGLNETAFQHSPTTSSCGFDSPVDPTTNDPQKLLPLVEGLVPFVQIKNGGFLRSMSPTLFKDITNGGSLIMQVSNPVVVPTGLGSNVMTILKSLTSIGIEKLSMQANKLMPLEDISGKSIQQIVWEARHVLSQHEYEVLQNIDSQKSRFPKTDSRNSLINDGEYVPLEDLALAAMDKIEALSLEGLRIQSGMSDDDDAPSNINTQFIDESSALKGKTVKNIGGSIGLDDACILQLLDVKDNGKEAVDGLMSLSLTLDEWMKLDSGEIDCDDLVNERTSKILVAHHATSLDQLQGRSKGEKRRSKCRKYGFLGNNLTVALMIQLHDPIRDYEPVGTQMLALIQVERVFIPSKLNVCSRFSLAKDSNKEEEDCTENSKKEEVHKEMIPRYKITEVHVAGMKLEPGKKRLWGSCKQQRSGSRWLLANGMAKKNKHPLMKSKYVAKSSGDTLWSISSHAPGLETKLEELSTIRNPNILLPSETA